MWPHCAATLFRRYLSTIVCFPVFLIVPIVSVYTKTHPVKELTTVLVILWISCVEMLCCRFL